MADKILARCGRVKVRRFRKGDLKERLQWPPYTDPFFAHLNYSLSTFLEREKWFLTRVTNAGRMYFAIEDENGRLIGEMSLREIESRARRARLGVHLASDKVGLGYGGEALAALLDYYFNDMRYNVMYLDVAAYNTTAIRLYERFHFRRLAPFWRVETKDLSVLHDPKHAEIRHHFRRRGGLVECCYHDMVLTEQEYQTRIANGARNGLSSPDASHGLTAADGRQSGAALDRA